MMNEFIMNWFGIAPGPSPILITKHGRQSLSNLYDALGFRRGAEIGVRRGEHAEMMCQTVPGLELLCVDPWTPQEGYLETKNTLEANSEWLALAQERLAPYRCQFIKQTSVVGAQLVPDRSLDFVYIDANHMAAFVREDLETWIPKVRVGGIIAGHDYANRPDKHIEVKEAVDAFTAERQIQPWFVLSGVKKDKMPSYFWVNA